MEKLERRVPYRFLCSFDLFNELLDGFEQDGLELPRVLVERLFPRSSDLLIFERGNGGCRRRPKQERRSLEND